MIWSGMSRRGMRMVMESCFDDVTRFLGFWFSSSFSLIFSWRWEAPLKHSDLLRD
jgi:hypothetical protein